MRVRSPLLYGLGVLLGCAQGVVRLALAIPTRPASRGPFTASPNRRWSPLHPAMRRPAEDAHTPRQACPTL